MNTCDIAIIGAATSGAFFAQRMAKLGYSVHVIEKQSFEDFGRKMDIFHIAKRDFTNFGLPEAVPGDGAWAFEFSKNYTSSPYNNYRKTSTEPVVGLHMHEYIVRMNEWAKDAGASFEYEACFEDFLWENEKIAGIRYVDSNGEHKELFAKVVVDCSGIPSVARCKLPEGYGIETFPLTPQDMFYVTLWYVDLKHEEDLLNGTSNGWPFYKTWIAPQGNPHGAILGVGSTEGYEKGEQKFREMEETFVLPEYELEHIERNCTPYCRPPYSLVADKFLIAGDTACLTKPNNGEGVTSSMVHMEIAAEVLHQALQQGDCSKEALWPINVRYNQVQGADFSSTRALFTKAVTATKDEFDFFFRNDIIFKDQFPEAGNKEDGPGETLRMAAVIFLGLLKGEMSMSTVKTLINALSLGGKLKQLYLDYPHTPDGLAEWSAKADALWKEVGKMP